MSVSSDSVKSLREWLTCYPVADRLPTEGARKVSTHVDIRETDGVKLHFFYRDGCGLCLELKADGTWVWTVGQ